MQRDRSYLRTESKISLFSFSYLRTMQPGVLLIACFDNIALIFLIIYFSDIPKIHDINAFVFPKKKSDDAGSFERNVTLRGSAVYFYPAS